MNPGTLRWRRTGCTGRPLIARSRQLWLALWLGASTLMFQGYPALSAGSAWAAERQAGPQRARIKGYDIAASIASPPAVTGGFGPGRPEHAMHGGDPAPGDRHLLVTIVDSRTRKRIADASIVAYLKNSAGVVEEKPLDSMTIANTPGYGNFFASAALRPLVVQLEIRGLGEPGLTRVVFHFK